MAAIIIDENSNLKAKTALKVVSTEYGGGGGAGSKETVLSALDDYTAFEVKSSNELSVLDFFIRSCHEQKDNNVWVDWGDGSITTKLKDIPSADYYYSYKNIIESELSDEGEYNVVVRHAYQTPGKYIVKIYGNSYWGLMTGIKGIEDDPTKPGKKRSIGNVDSMISRMFDTDLPLATCVLDMASFCQKNNVLEELRIPNYYNFGNVINWTSAFSNCYKLSSISGNKAKMFTKRIYAARAMFSGCSSLVTSNMPVPGNMTNGSWASFYSGCTSLSSNIVDLIPSAGFDTKKVNVSNMFLNCKNLTGNLSSVSALLWGDTTKIWTSTDCFKGSSLSAQAPISWGGTAPNPKSPVLTGDYGTIDDLVSTAKALSALITNLGGKISADVE